MTVTWNMLHSTKKFKDIRALAKQSEDDKMIASVELAMMLSELGLPYTITYISALFATKSSFNIIEYINNTNRVTDIAETLYTVLTFSQIEAQQNVILAILMANVELDV